MTGDVPARLRAQAEACGRLGSPLYALLLDRAALDFEQGGPTRPLLAPRAGDPSGSVLPLRLAGAVHRLVLEGAAPELGERYAEWAGAGVASPDESARERTWEAFRAVLDERAERLAELVGLPVQTNEVGRCAALLPGFFAIASRTGLPLRLLEVGASAGLNLGWDDYRYEAEGFAWGPEDSPVRIGFELGGTVDRVRAAVAERRGCDTDPVDPATEEGRLTLLSYCWPDQTERLARLRAALEIAAGRGAAVERRGAAEWVAEQLAAPAPGVATVVFHSIVMQYLPDGDRAEVRLTVWPGGEDRALLRAGYHGTPVEIAG